MKANTPRPRGNHGFTLLETLVALAIMVIGIIATMQLFPLSLLQARQAAERTVTSQVAASVFGQIRASTAEALLLYKIPQSLLQVDRANGLYGYNTSVQSMGGAEEVHLQRITLIMNFADERKESYVTYVAKQ